MLKIFLSYARADGIQAAARLRTELERANFTVWRDIEEMRGGLEWKEQLRMALREVDVVLVLITPEGIKSPHVTWEWENALTLQKRIIPLLILPSALPEELSRLHHHNLSHSESYALELMALVRDLNSLENVIATPADSKVTTILPSAPIQGSFIQPNWNVQGNVMQAQRDIVTGGKVINQESRILSQVFADLMKHIRSLPVDDQALVKPIVEQAQAQAEKIQNGDDTLEAQNTLEKRLKNLLAMAPDLGELAITMLTNPTAGIAMAIQKIAKRVKEDRKS